MCGFFSHCLNRTVSHPENINLIEPNVDVFGLNFNRYYDEFRAFSSAKVCRLSASITNASHFPFCFITGWCICVDLYPRAVLLGGLQYSQAHLIFSLYQKKKSKDFFLFCWKKNFLNFFFILTHNRRRILSALPAKVSQHSLWVFFDTRDLEMSGFLCLLHTTWTFWN